MRALGADIKGVSLDPKKGPKNIFLFTSSFGKSEQMIIFFTFPLGWDLEPVYPALDVLVLKIFNLEFDLRGIWSKNFQ